MANGQWQMEMVNGKWQIEPLLLRRAQLQFLLPAQNRAPILVIGDGHAALDTDTGALDGLAGLATK
jgi:hypothetical protein